jgi:hypothetical protein
VVEAGAAQLLSIFQPRRFPALLQLRLAPVLTHSALFVRLLLVHLLGKTSTAVGLVGLALAVLLILKAAAVAVLLLPNLLK